MFFDRTHPSKTVRSLLPVPELVPRFVSWLRSLLGREQFIPSLRESMHITRYWEKRPSTIDLRLTYPVVTHCTRTFDLVLKCYAADVL
jgi:hypothetical protein